jgi:orotidine-5'-phosphate decarboxylase
VNPVLVALDVDTAQKAISAGNALRGLVGGLKVGSRLFTAEGPALVRALVEQGDRVFLDLKFHDIPTTVAHAVEAAAGLGVWMLNVHASGGTKMMRAAGDASMRAFERTGHRPLVIAVTVLTSFDDGMLRSVGIERPMHAQVEALAAQAQEAGLDGVVASPREIAAVRSRCGPGFQIVTPGIRTGPTTPGDDQVRTMSAADAMGAGADYLVIGRPILHAEDPAAAATAIAASIAR